jgi:hypothetical protein
MRFGSLFDTKQRFEEANVIGVSSSAARSSVREVRRHTHYLRRGPRFQENKELKQNYSTGGEKTTPHTN